MNYAIIIHNFFKKISIQLKLYGVILKCYNFDSEGYVIQDYMIKMKRLKYTPGL